MYKVVSTSPTFGKFVKEPVLYLEEHDCQIHYLSENIISDESLLSEELKDADAYIVGFERVTSQFLKKSHKLKVVAKHGVGVDNIDVQALKEKNITLVFAPGGNKYAVAEFVFGLLLTASRNIHAAIDAVREEKWPRMIGYDLYGKTIGVIGTGNIGKEVIKRAQGFHMNILAVDLYPDHSFAKEIGFTYTSMETLLKNADYITIHTSLNDSSRALIGKKELTIMKNNAFLVNTARGGIVDETVLYEALSNHVIRGAALDVFEREPIGPSPLLTLPNFIATPHIAGYSYGALYETGMMTARNILNVLQGKPAEFEYQYDE